MTFVSFGCIVNLVSERKKLHHRVSPKRAEISRIVSVTGERLIGLAFS